MNGIARDTEEVSRLALALALALGLHAALLLAIPTDGWSPRHPRPLHFDVALLPPMARPENPAPLIATAPEPPELTAPSDPVAAFDAGSPEPTVQPDPVAAGVAPEPALPPPEPSPVPSPSPALTPLPPPVAAIPPAPQSVTPRVTPAKPSVATAITPLPQASAKPVKPAKALPDRPTPPPRKAAMVEPSSKPPGVKPPPQPPRFAPTETFRSSIEKPPPADRMERPRRGGAGGTGASGRLDSAALLNQIAGLDAETQRQLGGGARERRISLADTRSLAGFYAADWARKVTRVGEMNFPDAARRLSPGAGPLLDVAIRADGSLRNVRVLRSSGNAELDQAARRIVQLAAPYPPFPPELRQQVELLHIEAPWRFDPGGQVQVR